MLSTAILLLQEAGSPLGANSFWQLVQYARGFEYPIGFVFVIGLFLICTTYVRALHQWKKHRMLSRTDPNVVTQVVLEEAMAQMPPSNPYRVACAKLLKGQGRGNTLNYVLQYVDLDHQRCRETDRYINAAVYIVLSLGLLGTLLGIFVLFTTSRSEAPELVGLGIAVVSTLLALVVRLILWPVNLIVQVWMRRRYQNLKEWCTLLALKLEEDHAEQGGMGQGAAR